MFGNLWGFVREGEVILQELIKLNENKILYAGFKILADPSTQRGLNEIEEVGRVLDFYQPARERYVEWATKSEYLILAKTSNKSPFYKDFSSERKIASKLFSKKSPELPKIISHVRRQLQILQALQVHPPEEKKIIEPIPQIVYSDDQIHIEAGRILKAQTTIEEILERAESYLKLWDPYVDVKTLALLEVVPNAIRIKVLTATVKDKKRFRENLELLRKRGKTIEVKCFLGTNSNRSPVVPFHDRYILTLKEAWHCGASIGEGFGKKATTLSKLNDDSKMKIEASFDDYWNKNEIDFEGFKIRVENI